jgi:hypothetical protein
MAWHVSKFLLADGFSNMCRCPSAPLGRGWGEGVPNLKYLVWCPCKKADRGSGAAKLGTGANNRGRNPLTPTLVWGFCCQAAIWPHRSPFHLLGLSSAAVEGSAPIDSHESGGDGPAADASARDDLSRACPGWRHRATTLYSVDRRRRCRRKIRTMMQPCASAARLLEGGPILSLGVDAMGGGGSPPTRIVLALRRRRANAEPVEPCVSSYAVSPNCSYRRTQLDARRHCAAPHVVP